MGMLESDGEVIFCRNFNIMGKKRRHIAKEIRRNFQSSSVLP